MNPGGDEELPSYGDFASISLLSITVILGVNAYDPDCMISEEVLKCIFATPERPSEPIH
jgi:hypothetical protein